MCLSVLQHITYLRRRPTFGEAQLKMVLHGSEKVLETFSCTIQEALEKGLLGKSTQIRNRLRTNTDMLIVICGFVYSPCSCAKSELKLSDKSRATLAIREHFFKKHADD